LRGIGLGLLTWSSTPLQEKAVEVPVDKIVYKDVEVPVEKILVKEKIVEGEAVEAEKIRVVVAADEAVASKAAGVADRQPIMEGNDFVNRMQKLAGII
jgi:hypothetical protein